MRKKPCLASPPLPLNENNKSQLILNILFFTITLKIYIKVQCFFKKSKRMDVLMRNSIHRKLKTHILGLQVLYGNFWLL